jgi:vacuolar protein sorting-associated protein 13A/C
LQRLLNNLLGEYLEGFDSKNLSVGLWSGEVLIQNVRVKKSLILSLGLPLELKYSFI